MNIHLRRNGASLAAAMAVVSSLAGGPASAQVVFSESFVTPVVAGFASNTVPSGGNWIGATLGYGASNRGLYNDTVAWPATPAFTTPYGDQAYYINYTNSGLTTAQGATGQTLTAGVTYHVSFNTAVTAGTTSANYLVELVAFDPAHDNASRTNCQAIRVGTVLASASGATTSNDMSASRQLVFTPDGANASLGKEVGVRLIKSSGSMLYDNIRLLTGHDLNPSPANGEDLDAGGNVTLIWTNLPPNAPATDTYVDVWFGTDPYLFDTDNDGAGDWYGVAATFTDPNSDTETSPIPYPLPDPDPVDLGATDKPVKVYIMAGQSNMVGIGYINDLGEPGSLATIAKLENKFSNLVDASNNWTKRNDVIYKGVVTATAAGPLTAGQGADSSQIGPELGFGQVMGWFHCEPVLIIKASQGNRSLAWDFCAPGTPRFEIGSTTYAGYGDTPASWPTGTTPTPVNWYAGKQYDDCFLDEADWAPAGAAFPAITNAADILDFTTGQLKNLPSEGNNLNDRTFEIAGFCWWQGHKDCENAVYAAQYDENLPRLIDSLRADFNAPSAPFVVATIGFNGGNYAPGSNYDLIHTAQMAVGDPAQFPRAIGWLRVVRSGPADEA